MCFLCFGNGALTALHDKSDGFFRRQIVLTTKDRPAGRADDPFLVDKLLREKEGIFLWCLEGLHRLIGNNYQFSISKAKEKYGDGQAQQQQCDRVSAIRGLYPLSGRQRSQLQGDL